METTIFEKLLAIPIRNGLTKPSAIRGNGVKMVGMGELFANNIIFDIEMPRVPVTEKELVNCSLQEDDLLFARQSLKLEGAGKCSIIKNINEDTVFESHLIRVRINKTIADPTYIFYYFNSKEGHNNVLSLVQQVAAAGIRGSELIKLQIPTPSINDQRRIAAILSSLDRKIELNNKINAQLEEMAQTLFKHWFVDFSPFKKGNFIESELGMIPEGWRVGRLGDFGQIICGKTPSKACNNYYGGEIPFIKIPDMHGNCFVIDSEDHLSKEGSLSQVKKLIPPYSIMVSCIATVGLVAINSYASHTNQQINTVVPKKNRLYYLFLLLRQMEESLKNMGRGGTTTLNVNTSSFSNIKIVIPREIVCHDFDKIISPLFFKIESNQKENQKLSALRDTLLPKLMSGEISLESDLPLSDSRDGANETKASYLARPKKEESRKSFVS